MKIAIIGDMHIGIRNGSDIFDNYFKKSFEKFIIPILDKYEIKEVYQLGDMFHDRKAVATKSITSSKEYFFHDIYSKDITLHTLVGNHDIYYKESLSVVSQIEFLSEFKNIVVHDTPTVSIDSGFAIIPWICEENHEEVMSFIDKTEAKILLGHLEIQNFQMYRGVNSRGGLSPKIFEKFKYVWSGHYHTRSSSGNISYLGTPYELTWQDCDDPRGIHVYDTETDVLEFFENPFRIFRKIKYEENFNLDDVSMYNECFVKVYVIEKNDQVKFDKFIEKLYASGAHSVDIIEDLSEFKETAEIEEEINAEDTMDIIKRYIDSVDTDKDKSKIKDYMQEIYLESVNKTWQ